MKKTILSMPSRTNLTALFAAFCLFLSTMEYLIPKPFPFLRIGLANLPILISLKILPPLWFAFLLGLKVITQGLVHGTIFSYVFLFSVLSTFSSGFVMFILYKLYPKYISFTGISLLGALTSNIVQLFAAGVLLFGSSIWIIAPPLLIIGSISGFSLGLFAEIFSKKSRWLKEHLTL